MKVAGASASAPSGVSRGLPEHVYAQSGDTPADVAQRYGISEPALRAANPGIGERLFAGERIALPGATQVETKKVGGQTAAGASDAKPQVYVQGTVGASAQAFMGGVSVSGGVAVSTNGQVCAVRTACVRIGPGFYAGAGGGIGAGVVRGGTESLGGLSVGVGGDVGFGPSAGGQVSVGVNADGTLSSGGAAKGKGGGGFGLGAGVDICYTKVNCTQ